MAGLFQGFGRSDKKKNNNKDDQSQATAGTTAPPMPAENTQTLQPHTDRSNHMRLSKGSSNKPDNDFDIPSDTVIPSFSGGASKPAGSDVKSLGPKAIIGPKIRFKGEISGEEDLLIEGQVDGIIELKNNHLTIGKQGKVKADVIAKSITIEGTVEGDIVASERIAIKASSNVSGNVSADRVTLDDGAKFRGSIDMDTSPSTAKSNTSASKSTTSTSAPLSGSTEKAKI